MQILHLTIDFYQVQGIIMAMFVNTYWWARSCKVRLVWSLVPTPSNTLPTSPSSSSTSHMCLFTMSNFYKYSRIKPRHSSQLRPFAIDASNHAILHTYNFNVFMYLYGIHPYNAY